MQVKYEIIWRQQSSHWTKVAGAIIVTLKVWDQVMQPIRIIYLLLLLLFLFFFTELGCFYAFYPAGLDPTNRRSGYHNTHWEGMLVGAGSGRLHTKKENLEINHWTVVCEVGSPTNYATLISPLSITLLYHFYQFVKLTSPNQDFFMHIKAKNSIKLAT